MSNDIIAHEIIRLTADRDAFVAEANGRIAFLNALIARWQGLLEPTITQGEEGAATTNGTGALPVDTNRG
jgi:hypothetical protein